MFQQRHYKAIAAVFSRMHPQHASYTAPQRTGAQAQWDATVQELAETFAIDNARFNKCKFFEACQP